MEAAIQALLDDPSTNLLHHLGSGRAVSYVDCGDSNGHPVFMFPPIFGNRLMAVSSHLVGCRLGLRLICMNRPGRGQSDPQPGRTVLGYCREDVRELADHLKLGKFSVWGASAGTMYALACSVAPETRDRIVGKVSVVSPWVPATAPGTSPLSSLAGYAPSWIVGAFGSAMFAVVKRQLLADKPGSDPVVDKYSPEEAKYYYAHPEKAMVWKAMVGDLRRLGESAGFAQEVQLCTSSPGFDYSEVPAPVRCYFGSDDETTDHKAVRWWAEHTPGVELVDVPGGTHSGTMLTHTALSLEALARDLGLRPAGEQAAAGAAQSGAP